MYIYTWILFWNFLRIVTMEQHFRHTLAETRLSEETRKLQAKWKRFEETSVEYCKIASILFGDVGRLIAGKSRCLKYRDTRIRLMSARNNFRFCSDLSVFYVSRSLLFQQREKKESSRFSHAVGKSLAQSWNEKSYVTRKILSQFPRIWKIFWRWKHTIWSKMLQRTQEGYVLTRDCGLPIKINYVFVWLF